MKILAISVVELSLSGTRRGGTAVYIASLIAALREISEMDLCLLDHAHSDEVVSKGRVERFTKGPIPGLLVRHWLSWTAGVKASVWSYNSVSLKHFLKAVKAESYDAAVFLEENAAIYVKYLPSGMPKILVRHNLDSESIKLNKASFPDYVRTSAAKYLSRRFDRWTLQQFSKVTIGTDSERKILQGLGEPSAVSLLPTITRFDIREAPYEKINVETNSFKAIFVGGFDYPPNREAVDWLIKCGDYLSPELLAVLEVVLVGKSPPEIPAGCKIKLRALGFVNDLDSILAQCQLAVIPIISGSGVKMKSLTLLASGLPVITTSEGVRGIDVRNEVECLVADDQKSFAGAMERIYADSNLADRLQKNAYAFIRTNFSAQKQNEVLTRIIGDAIGSANLTEHV